MKVGKYTYEEFMELAKEFHGYPAAGLLLAGYMVEKAKGLIDKDVQFQAISETQFCLPDAIQMLTPCTVGNGGLAILDLGLYALSIYDKENGKGVRVAMDPGKVDPYPELKAWYLKLKPKSKLDENLLFEDIKRAGDAVTSVKEITVMPGFLEKPSKGEIAICPKCKEGYPLKNGDVCRLCGGNSPYQD